MRLQKVPVGLLGALELKTEGHNPGAFGDTLVPTFEAADFYGLPNVRLVAATTLNVNTVASVAGAITVPVGEVWRLRFGGFTLEGFTAADQAWAALVADRVATPLVVLTQMPAPIAAAATDVMFHGAPFNTLLPSGTRIFTTLQRVPAAGSIDIQTRVWVEIFET